MRRLLNILLLALACLGGFLPLAAQCKPRQVAPWEIPAAARKTLAHILAHGEAPPGHVGGRRFGNYGRGGEQKLPITDAVGRKIAYREWDIHPRVPGRNRGPERLVTGSDQRAWYTADHYCTFTELK